MAIRTGRTVGSTAALLTIGVSSLAVASPPLDVGTSGEVPTMPTVPTSTIETGDGEPGDGNATDSTDPGGVEPLDVDDVDKEIDVPPVIHCLWVVADMAVDDGVQRVVDGRADDLPDTPTPTPCSSDPASGASVVVDSPGPVAHVRPWSGDEPDARTVEIWVVTSHAAGPQAITSVDVVAESESVVFDPGPPESGPDLAADAVAAGLASSQIAGLPGDDIVGMLDDGWAVAHRSVARLSYLDGCGAVTLVVDAAADGATRSASVTFEVPCYHHLVADFEAVDWGVIVRGVENIVPGDLDPATGDRPTVRNLGNAPLGLAAEFESLCPVGSTTGCIGSFGIEVTGRDAAYARLAPQAPGTTLEPEVIVCPGDVAALDLVIAAPDEAVGGEYAGSMSIVGLPAGSGCPGGDDRSPPPTTEAPGPTSSVVEPTVPGPTVSATTTPVTSSVTSPATTTVTSSTGAPGP